MRQVRQKNGIKRSASGFYSFRKQVPEKLRSLWGKREEKIKLETKDEVMALSRGAILLAQFNAKAIKLTKMLENPIELTSLEILNLADTRVRGWGIHPDQAPVLKAGHTQAEYNSFKDAECKYLEIQDLYYDVASEDLIDEERRKQDYQSGKWGQPNYETPYKKPNWNTMTGATYNIVSGRTITTITPTVQDALSSYIEHYKEKNAGGNPRTIQSIITNTERVLGQFAALIEGGRPSKGFERLITSIKVEDAISFRSFLRGKYPNSSEVPLVS